nr:endo-1,4-beta-xylanase [uncultured Prevotella sp.]
MKKITTLALGLLLASAAFAQKGNKAEVLPSLQSTLGKHFLIGVAVDTRLPAGQDPAAEAVVKEQFNQVVAENCMKGEENHPEVNRFDFTDGDKLVDWAERNGKTVIGHCLVWHSQPPKWMFTDANGKTVSREVLIGRMYNHIMTVVTHYKGKIKGWDVVNEAFEDDGSYRKSPYYNIIGPEFIELAFQFAHEADPNVELYYNDYSTSKPGKREAICKLVRSLKSKGLRIDAVGMQSHNGYNYPDYAEYEKSIEAFAAEGVKVMMTELDVNMLPNPEGFGGAEVSQNFELQAKYNPYVKGLDKKAQKLFNQRYLDLFKIIERHKDVISRVTFWGVNDGHTWLNDWPIKGRTNYPTLIDRNNQLKPVVKDIEKIFE